MCVSRSDFEISIILTFYELPPEVVGAVLTAVGKIMEEHAQRGLEPAPKKVIESKSETNHKG